MIFFVVIQLVKQMIMINNNETLENNISCSNCRYLSYCDSLCEKWGFDKTQLRKLISTLVFNNDIEILKFLVLNPTHCNFKLKTLRFLYRLSK